MKILILFIIAYIQAQAGIAQGQVGNPVFHATFTKTGGPFALPKTVDEAQAMDYTEYEDYNRIVGHHGYDHHYHHGLDHQYRFVSPELDKILIFDINQNIAGMHSIFPVSAGAENRSVFDYTKSGWYRQTSIDDVEYYMTTAYFMNPSEVSKVGRTIEDVDSETVRQLFFQVNDHFVEAPMTMTSDEDGKGGWYFQSCFPGMGYHYDHFDPKDASTLSCDDVPPVRLIYHDEVLHDFQWLHFFKFMEVIPEGTTLQDWLVVNPWEPVSEAFAKALLNPPPTCLMGEDGLIQKVGLNGQHVWIRDWKNIGCP